MQMLALESEPGECVTLTMPLRADAQVLSPPFDETQPFPPPLAGQDSALDAMEKTPVTRVRRLPALPEGTLSLEQATENGLEQLRTGRGHASARTVNDNSTPLATERTPVLLVPASHANVPPSSARLCWRGIEVSDEFQGYALRVARGEELAPYRGRVLARGAPDFPWHTAELREPPRRGARLVGLSIGALLAALTAALGFLEAPPDGAYRQPSAILESAPVPSGVAAVAPPSNESHRSDAAPVTAALRGASVPPNAVRIPQKPLAPARAPRRPAREAPHAPARAASPLLVEAPPF